MLDFFVLGEIPGTNMVLTFSWVVIVGVVLLGFGEATVLYARRKKPTEEQNTTPQLAE